MTFLKSWKSGKLEFPSGVSLRAIGLSLAVGMAALVSPGTASAQDWPSKPITLIVPFSAGGSTDLVARILAPKMAETLGVSVQVVNKPGAAGVTANLEVFTSPPDGYTLLVDNNSGSTIQAAVMDNLPYKLNERTYINRLTLNPTALIVPAESSWNSIEDLVADIKANPAEVSFAVLSGSSVSDINVMQFRAALMEQGIAASETKTVSFKGSGEVSVAQAGGHVDVSFLGIPSATALMDAGKLRALAVVTTDRFPGWPDVPTMGELGFSNVELAYWIGLSGPQNMQADVVQKIDAAAAKAIQDPEVMAQLSALGAAPAYLSTQEHNAFVTTEADLIVATIQSTKTN